MRRCKWARRKNTSLRCEDIEVAQNCPKTCDTDCLRPPLSPTGCRDSRFSFRLISSLAWKTCKWAARARTFKRCRRYPTKLWCPLTCETCNNEPSVAPTLSQMPSKSPTGVPSPSPTLSQVPSKAPTGKPTSRPTFICDDEPIRFFVQAPINKFKTCVPWVDKNPSYRCTLTAEYESEPPRRISDICPKSCGSCPNEPSASPSRSLMPSVTPTTSPSRKPSHRPSMLPSRDPSEQPSDTPSVVPSHQPSNQPSVCVDFYWEVDFEISPGVTTKITCSNIGSFCTTDGIGTVYYNGRNAAESCCICGGSERYSAPPSVTPSIVPSQMPSECTNYPLSDPTSWTTSHDINGDGIFEIYTCASFVDGQNCDPISTPGTDLKTASQACCACGGGNHIATAP